MLVTAIWDVRLLVFRNFGLIFDWAYRYNGDLGYGISGILG